MFYRSSQDRNFIILIGVCLLHKSITHAFLSSHRKLVIFSSLWSSIPRSLQFLCCIEFSLCNFHAHMFFGDKGIKSACFWLALISIIIPLEAHGIFFFMQNRKKRDNTRQGQLQEWTEHCLTAILKIQNQ